MRDALEKLNKLSQTMSKYQEQKQERFTEQHRWMMNLGAEYGAMTENMKKSMEQLQQMLQDKEMLRDREMEQEMLRLHENMQETSKYVEKAVQSMERMMKRLEEAETSE